MKLAQILNENFDDNESAVISFTLPRNINVTNAILWDYAEQQEIATIEDIYLNNHNVVIKLLWAEEANESISDEFKHDFLSWYKQHHKISNTSSTYRDNTFEPLYKKDPNFGMASHRREQRFQSGYDTSNYK